MPLNYISNQKQNQQKRTHKISGPIGVDVVAKTDDKICLKYYQTL